MDAFNPQEMQVSITVAIDIALPFQVNAMKTDTISKLKSRIFIQKDYLVEKQVISIGGQKYGDGKTLIDVGFDGSQEVKLTLTNDAASPDTGDSEQLDWASITKDGQAFIKVKDEKGTEVLKQYGMIKDDGQHQFKFDGDAPSAWELLKQDKLVFLSEGSEFAKLTLESHPGKSLMLLEKKDHYEGHDVLWSGLGPEEKAIEVFIAQKPFGSYIKLAFRTGHQFDCAMGKYHNDNKVPIYHAHNGGNQWFCVNQDRTVSPTHSPTMVWGLNKENELVLTNKGAENQLVFKELKPSHSVKQSFKMTLSSHPGMAVVKNGSFQQYGHGCDFYLNLHMAKYAMSAYIDEEGILHDADMPFLVYDGWDHLNTAPHLFTNHPEYEHQKWKINQDGTISLNKDPDYVLGCDGGIMVKMVKRGSEDQFVFEEALDYLVKIQQER